MMRRDGPWTPIVNWDSISEVRLGPVISETWGEGIWV
jgi:hypothetical protein